ncbi:MAG: hypothetical protein LBV55_00700 [Acholeplasmatales bacterium]|jgi:hypothetical protein|nr:hypothetical protein [Acholeplasmatales bacterium]
MKKLLLLLLLPIFAVAFASCKPKEEKIDVTKLNSVWDLVGYEYAENEKDVKNWVQIIQGEEENTFYVFLKGETHYFNSPYADRPELVSENSHYIQFTNTRNPKTKFTIIKINGLYSWFQIDNISSIYKLNFRTKISGNVELY